MGVSHGQELSTGFGWQLVNTRAAVAVSLSLTLSIYVESRHDALDSPSTLGIWVPSPVAWGRNIFRELRLQRRHALGDDGGGSLLTSASYRYDRGAPARNSSAVLCCCIYQF